MRFRQPLRSIHSGSARAGRRQSASRSADVTRFICDVDREFCARIRESLTMIPGAKVGPYQIVSPLGSGGMGEVFLARDTRLDRRVALKLLPSTDEVRRRR